MTLTALTAALLSVAIAAAAPTTDNQKKGNKDRDVNEFGTHERNWAEDVLAHPEECITVSRDVGLEESADTIASMMTKTARPAGLSRTLVEIETGVQTLREERKVLSDEKSAFIERKAELAVAERRAAQELDRLAALKTEILGLIDELEEKEAENVAYVARLVENMTAKDGARLLATNEDDFILTVLSKLDERLAAEVIAKMDEPKAEGLMIALAERGKRKTSE